MTVFTPGAPPVLPLLPRSSCALGLTWKPIHLARACQVMPCPRSHTLAYLRRLMRGALPRHPANLAPLAMQPSAPRGRGGQFATPTPAAAALTASAWDPLWPASTRPSAGPLGSARRASPTPPSPHAAPAPPTAMGSGVRQPPSAFPASTQRPALPRLFPFPQTAQQPPAPMASICPLARAWRAVLGQRGGGRCHLLRAVRRQLLLPQWRSLLHCLHCGLDFTSWVYQLVCMHGPQCCRRLLQCWSVQSFGRQQLLRLPALPPQHLHLRLQLCRQLYSLPL